MADEKDSGGAEWMQKYWRPAMGWMYMLICFCDMIIFPILWSLLQSLQHQQITQWDPLTLKGAGLFHIAMGAVLGIAAFGRTQEKLAGTAANPTSTTQTVNNNMSGNVSGGFGSGQQNTNNFGGGSTFGSPAPGGFGSASSFGAPASSGSASGFGSAPATSGFGATNAPAGGFNPSAAFGATTTPAVTASGKKIVPTDDPVL